MINIKIPPHRPKTALLLMALVVASLLKGWLILSEAVPFNSDEAVVALMARHILQGERPIFFYGQAYMGSLDAWIIMLGFSLLGEHIWVIRIVQGLLYLGTMITTVKLGEVAFRKWRTGIIAAWLLAVPTVNMTLYTTASLGGYGEALLLGNLILITGLRIANDISSYQPVKSLSWMLWGFLVGLGVWVFGITLVYSIPMVIYLVWTIWSSRAKHTLGRKQWFWVNCRSLGLALIGAIIGSLPWWIFAFRHGLGGLMRELFGGAIAGVEGQSWIINIFIRMWSFLLFGSTATFGLRPPWEIRWLALPILPVVLALWAGVIAYMVSRARSRQPNRREANLLFGVMITLAFGFIMTPFGADPSGRYFLPLSIPLVLYAAEMILYLQKRLGNWAYGLILLVLVYNTWGTIESAKRFPPGITTQFNPITRVDHRYMDYLISFLKEQGETRGYTNYWVAYPLAFQSKEELIFVPQLPYHLDFRHTERDDRYEPYEEMVNQAQRVAYITSNHFPLDAYLRNAFSNLGLRWQEIEIGDYHVFYDLSQIVRPRQIGLGETTEP